MYSRGFVSTHSHPKVAAQSHRDFCCEFCVSTHSHPKVAAGITSSPLLLITGFNTQPPEGGCASIASLLPCHAWFQHTATRRWLRRSCSPAQSTTGFNTQPPEGGCYGTGLNPSLRGCFNTQPPEGGCWCLPPVRPAVSRFNTQPPEGGCLPCC